MEDYFVHPTSIIDDNVEILDVEIEETAIEETVMEEITVEPHDVQKRVKEIIPVYLRNARKIKAWMEKNNTTNPPRNSGKNITSSESQLGRAYTNIKRNLIRIYRRLHTTDEKEKFFENIEKNSHLTREQFEEILRIVEEIEAKQVPTYLRNAREIKQWMVKNNTNFPPNRYKKNSTDEEVRLYGAYQSILRELIKVFYKCETEEEKKSFFDKIKKNSHLTKEDFFEILSIIEEIKRNIPKKRKSAYLENAREIKKWMQENKTTHPPCFQKRDVPEEERRLGTALNNIRMVLIKPYEAMQNEKERKEFIRRLAKLSEIEFLEILQIVREIDQNNIPNCLLRARELKMWLDSRKDKRGPRTSNKSYVPNDEKREGRIFVRIRKNLARPFEMCKTEEDREEFFAMIEKRYRLTREQFDEVYGIYTEVDKSIPKQRVDGQEIGKTTYLADVTDCDKADKIVDELIQSKEEKVEE